MKITIVVVLAFLLARANASIVQTCYYTTESWEINSFDGPRRVYRECYINNHDLINENETVTTILAGRTHKADNIELIYYGNQKKVKFIPNSLFSTFKNLEYFMIFDNNHFETMKPEFLKNATKLKNFRIMHNDINKLDKNIFIEAPYLENINLRNNKIESVHQMAFNGLLYLKGIFLVDNKITNIHPTAFSHLVSLQTLNLENNVCLNIVFQYLNQELDQIETEIKKACNFEMELTAARETEVEMISTEVCQEKLQKFQELQHNDKKTIQKEFMEEFSKKMIEDMKILIQQNVKETCSVEIQKSEHTYYKGYMTLIQLMQDLKVANQKEDEEITKSCKRDVLDLKASIRNVTDSYEKIFKMLEQDGFQLTSNENY